MLYYATPASNMGFNLATLLNPWVLIGFFGQFIFFMRFIVQWLVSEKHERVVIPKSFWYLSILGTLIILVYAVHIHDIVFTVAQVASLFIYARNLMFEAKLARQEAARKSETETP
jgi:lipid-A-disaccharide synthase-like uncharacterized protein